VNSQRQKAKGKNLLARRKLPAALPRWFLASRLSSLVFRLSPFISRLLFSAFCLWLFAFCLSARVNAGEPRPVVRVAAESVAHQDLLTLGDIAEIEAEEAETEERLRAIALGYAPQVGAMRELPRARIALALAAAGFPENAVRLEAPPAALIRRAAQVVEPALVREAVERVALAELTARGATARLARLDLPPVIEAPSGAMEVRASITGARDLFSPFITAIELWVDGRVARRLSLTAQVEAHAPVLVAARALAASTRVRKEDVTIEVRRLERDAALYLYDPERLRGVSLHRAVARGEALTRDLLTAEIVVRPGEQVRIIGQSQGLQISVTGEARAAGRVGDRIQVKNLQSGILLQAVIVDEGVVAVRF
jgi:flagella basal body P-ring formation protein FlgA